MYVPSTLRGPFFEFCQWACNVKYCTLCGTCNKIELVFCNVGKEKQSTALSYETLIKPTDDKAHKDSGMETDFSIEHMPFQVPVSCYGKLKNYTLHKCSWIL